MSQPPRQNTRLPGGQSVAALTLVLACTAGLVGCAGPNGSAPAIPSAPVSATVDAAAPTAMTAPAAAVAPDIDVCTAVREVAAAIDANPSFLPEAVGVQIFGKLAPETATQVDWLRENADAVAQADCPAELRKVLDQGQAVSLRQILGG